MGRLVFAFLALPLLAQEGPVEKLASKCDSQIEWISDGLPLADNEGGKKTAKPAREPLKALDEAKERARKEQRLILWYVPRVTGPHMYRAALPDQYARIAYFTHPDVVDLVKRKFVPLRAMADEPMLEAMALKRLEFVEPAILLLTPDGEIVHAIDRIRTFNADWLVEVLEGVLKKHAKYNPKGGEPLHPAVEARRNRRGEEALKLLADEKAPWAAVERGRVLLAMGRLDEARKALAGSDSAEALYHLAVAENFSGDEESADKHWKELLRKHVDSPWAWHAAANFLPDVDTLPKGPLFHGFEDVFWAPDAAYESPTRTRLVRKRDDLKDVVKRAVEWLLRMQRSNGGWEDSRYSYWPDSGILPNVWIAQSAIAATALLAWRDVAPDRIDKALERAEKYFLDESRMARGKNEEPYSDAFKILYLVRKGDLKKISGIVEHLARSQQKDGSWAHEYPNPFCTAAVLHALLLAKRAGAKIDESMIAKAADVLLKTRGEGGAQAYDSGRKASAHKDSMARTVVCDHALFEAGKLKVEDLAKAFEPFWEHRDRLERIRLCDFHSDGELGGFFFFHGVFFTSEAVKSLDTKDRGAHFEKFLDWMLAIGELDGSFLDSHEIGKSYGTGMALLVLRNASSR